MNLYEQQAANRRGTWLVIVGFIGLLFLVGAGFDLFVIGEGQTFVPIGSIAALAIGGGQAWWSLRFGDRAVLSSSAARPLSEVAAGAAEDARLRYTQLDNIVEEMAIAAGLPKPAVYIIPDPDPNAFATGPDAAHASIAVTEGLLTSLNREELQGVVAHEMSHVRNLDIRLMTVIAAMVGALVLLADWAGRWMRFGGGGGSRSSSRSKDKNGGGGLLFVFLVVWIIAVVLAPLLGQLLALAVSRRREYLADASGAELTRNPLGLASALEKIEGAVEPTSAIKRGTSHMCIADPLGRKVNAVEGRWASLWATHPPMPERIAALKAMAFQQVHAS